MKSIVLIGLIILMQGWETDAQEPSGVELGEFFFRLFPVSEKPNIKDRPDKKIPVYFHLYERKTSNLKRSTLEETNEEDEKEYKVLDTTKMEETVNRLNSSLPTIIIIHGFMENNKAKVIKNLLSATVESGRWNVMYVDWRTLSAGPWYNFALLNVRAAGRYVADFIDSLAKSYDQLAAQSSNDIPKETTASASSTFFKNLHVVGFSLGSHVAGVAGKHVTAGKIGRITGLDPALPLIENLKSERLDRSSAEFVNVVHTAGGSFGMRRAIGHVDFYPNGGEAIQPGCHNDIIPTGCSHWNAWRYFTESVQNERAFEALPCTSWRDFKDGECDRFKNELRGGPVYMGAHTRDTARGKYYLRTRAAAPYSMPL